MVNEPMMVAARQLHDEARKWSSKVSEHLKNSSGPLKSCTFRFIMLLLSPVGK